MKKIVVWSIVMLTVAARSQNVNEFNGSFSYLFPLLYLPSERGAGVNIDASYNAGIGVNQPASEIGLGWNLNSEAAIYRSVIGFPDDMSTYSITNMVSAETVTGQGALYPTQSAYTRDYDLSRTNKGPSLDSIDFTVPGFDNFSVAAPGFGGQMKLSYFKFYGYSKIDYGSSGSPNFKLTPFVESGAPGYRKPQFFFTSDFADTLVSRHYSTTVTNTTPYRSPATTLTALGYTSSAEPFIGKHLNGSTVSNQNFDITTGRLATSNFVEYFTNKEIDDASSHSFTLGTDALTAASNTFVPFIDYQSSHGRSSGTFPPEGIGYFRITGSNGLTYHYSLPVYELQTVNYSAPLKNDYSLPSCLSSPAYTYGLIGNPDNEVYPLGNDYSYLKTTSTNKYAVKWLLTAITGRDYVDANNNHMVDDSDPGYWVSYDYQLWSSAFVTRSPRYGFDYQYSQDAKSQHLPVYYEPEPPTITTPPIPSKITGLFASVSVSKGEVYHLSKIRTSSHSAVFVMDTRKDEKGANASDYVPGGFKPEPALKIKRILLLKNSDLASIVSSHPPTFSTSNFANYTSFNFTTSINSSATIFSEAWFQSIIPGSNASLLKNVEFDQDYSLCRKYHGNIEVTCPGTSPLMSPPTVQSTLAVSDYTSSGKLTLKRILIYDFQNVKVTPSTRFDYRADGDDYNPDYNPIKTDYWGYYKSDATDRGLSRYANSVSKAFTSAWSMASITDPLGGITEIEYESNSYNKVIDVEKGTRGPAFIYRIKDVNQLHNQFEVVMEEGSNGSYPVNEFLSLCSSTLTGLKKIVCLPYSEPTNPGSYYPPSFAGLAFGESTLAVNLGSSVTNTVNGEYFAYPDGAVWVSGNDRRKYSQDYVGVYSSSTKHSYSNGSLDIAYSGGGYILFETPIGYEAYGGGIRVRSIKTRNSSSEIYKREYIYENGVAGNEMDRFDYQVPKTGCGGSYARYDYLRGKACEIFEMPPSIGYSKVTARDLGRINASTSKVVTEFITDPGDYSSTFPNYAISSFYDTDNSTYLHIINECQNKFSSIFGAAYQTITYDKNDNQLSKTVSEYEPTQQGALTENFHFADYSYFLGTPTMSLGIVNILRDVPSVLKSTITYGGGTVKKTETLRRDELTGEGTVIRSSGSNKSTSLSYKTPAYKYYHGIESLDFTKAESRKMLPLGENLYTYSNIDTTLSASQLNSYSASFLNASYKLYSRKLRQLQFSSATGTMAPSDVTLSYYINNRRFQFDGGAGSIDVYGLLKKSSLNTNTLNLAATTTVSIWEPSISYNWKLINEITLIDDKRHALEARDGNNRFTSNKYCWNDYYLNSTATNCNYASFTFADFEAPVKATYTNGTSRFDGEMLVTTFTITSGSAHTGSNSIGIGANPAVFISSSAKSAGNTLDIGILPGRSYRASVWVHSTNLSNAAMVIKVDGVVNGSTPSTNTYIATSSGSLVTTIGSWNLLQTDFDIPENFSTSTNGQFKIELKSNSGLVLFDDFLFHPVEGDFSANVYDGQTGRLISNIDANGLATNYVYDASGKPVEVWKEIPHIGSTTGVYKKTRSNTYNFARGASN